MLLCSYLDIFRPEHNVFYFIIYILNIITSNYNTKINYNVTLYIIMIHIMNIICIVFFYANTDSVN
jgi:hypothetical protein